MKQFTAYMDKALGHIVHFRHCMGVVMHITQVNTFFISKESVKLIIRWKQSCSLNLAKVLFLPSASKHQKRVWRCNYNCQDFRDFSISGAQILFYVWEALFRWFRLLSVKMSTYTYILHFTLHNLDITSICYKSKKLIYKSKNTILPVH